MFVALVGLGQRSFSPSSPPSILVGRRSETPSPLPASAPAPTTEASPATAKSPTSSGEAAVSALKVSFVLPPGYRVAAALNVFEASRGGEKPFTVTQASVKREEAYIALLKELAASTSATEAPAFTPGQTITLAASAPGSAERSDAALASERESFTTEAGYAGTRYRRVQGVQTYDSAYVTLPDGSRVVIVMVYAAGEPAFDERAYAGVLSSLRYTAAGIKQ